MKLQPGEWYQADWRYYSIDKLFWMLLGMVCLAPGHHVLFWCLLIGMFATGLTNVVLMSKLEMPKGQKGRYGQLD